MARKDIHIPLDRENRNNFNSNFIELYKEIGNVVGSITDEVYDKIIDGSKLNWKEPVDSQSNLPGNAQKGDTRMTRDTGKVYRFDGSRWVEIQQIDAGPYNELDSKLTDEIKRTKRDGVTLSNFPSIEKAIDFAVQNNIPNIFLDVPDINLHNVDFKGLNVIGSNTEISGSPKGVKSLSGVIYRGIDLDMKQIGEFGSLSGTVTTKIFHKVSDTEFHIYSKKPYSNEYLDFRFEEGVSTTTNSAGSPAELMRVTGVFNLTKAYTQLTTPKSMTGLWEPYEQFLDSAAGIPGARNSALKFYRNTESTAATIEFDAYANEEGFISLGFFATNISAEDIKIKIEEVEVATVSAKAINGPYLLIKKIPTNAVGNVTVKIEKQGSAPVYVASNTFKLHETPVQAKVDNIAFFDNGEPYVANKGAMDYALVDENELYWGSYHGGETLVSRAALADKKAVASASPGTILPCISFRLDQTTQIGDLFESRTSQRITRDGFFDFDFSFIGDAVVRTVYTTMTTTENKFKYVIYPKLENTGTDGTYYYGKTNRITQEDINTRQKITTLFTRYENENNSNAGVFVRVTQGAYNKVYYGPVVGGLRRIKHLYGSNTRIFE